MSLHALPSGWKASAGHVLELPEQLSATSHTPVADRQTVPAGARASGGQVPPEPGQLSAGSQAPADGRQVVVAGSKASAGHAVLEPVQLSVTSQTPAAPRQVAPALPAGCWQELFTPSHWSRLQGLPSAVQAVPLAFFASAGLLYVLCRASYPRPILRGHPALDGAHPPDYVAEPLNVLQTDRPLGQTVEEAVVLDRDGVTLQPAVERSIGSEVVVLQLEHRENTIGVLRYESDRPSEWPKPLPDSLQLGEGQRRDALQPPCVAVPAP